MAIVTGTESQPIRVPNTVSPADPRVDFSQFSPHSPQRSWILNSRLQIANRWTLMPIDSSQRFINDHAAAAQRSRYSLRGSAGWLDGWMSGWLDGWPCTRCASISDKERSLSCRAITLRSPISDLCYANSQIPWPPFARLINCRCTFNYF